VSITRWSGSLATLALIAACIVCGMLPATAGAGPQGSQPMNMPSAQPMNSATAQPMNMGSAEPNMPTIPPPPTQNPNVPDPTPASYDNGTWWSVFNHRGAGVFIFLWGLTALIVGLMYPRQTWFRFVPPIVLLGLVEFLFLRNDPKSWPTGPYGFWISNQDPEVFEHRLFVLLLLAIAIVELLRAGGRLPKWAATWAVPGLAALGGVMLLFHHHGGFEMRQVMEQMANSAAGANERMQRMESSMVIVKREHLTFAILGFGLAIAKFLGDAGKLPVKLGMTLWAAFAVVLGFCLMSYTE